MKRVLCILSSLNAGGAETFMMKVYRALSPDEYQIDFIVSVENGCYTQEVLERGGRVYTIPERKKDFIGAFTGILSVIREHNYDTVLKLGENALAVTDLIAAKLGGAKVLALRSCNAPTGLSTGMRYMHNILRPLLNRLATVKLAPSGLAAEFMFGKNSDVHLIHNGVDLDVFHFDSEGRRRIREEFSIQDKLVVGHVGRFHKQKNHRYLLEVFRQIRRQRPDAVLILVGIGELEGQVREWVRGLELEDAVIFAGQRFDIPQLLSAMDVFVFPSLHEGMPNTVIEAQAAGLPCVIADTITPEADISGLVIYLPLTESKDIWADTALSAVSDVRRNTAGDFAAHGYDIHVAAKELMELLCG